MKGTSKKASPKLSTTTVWGAVAAAFLISSAILLSTNHLLAFFSIEGLMVVGGGVIAVAFMSYNAADVHAALAAIRGMFHAPATSHDNMHRDVRDILDWARIAKEGGMRALEQSTARNINDPYVKYGLTMVVSDYTPEEVRSMMETAAEAAYERDSAPAEVLQAMASHAPAFGMIGTLIGMVTMLYNLGDDPTGIGPALAVAFLSTLYGVLSARMLYMPAASKLIQKLDALRFRNQLLAEGMALLAAGKSPIFVQDRLCSFLKPGMHESPVLTMKGVNVPHLREVRV